MDLSYLAGSMIFIGLACFVAPPLWAIVSTLRDIRTALLLSAKIASIAAKISLSELNGELAEIYENEVSE